MDDLGIIHQAIEAFQKANPGMKAEIWGGPVFYGYTKEFFLFYTNFRPSRGKEQRKENERRYKSEILKRTGIKEEFYYTSPLVHLVVTMLNDPSYDSYKLIGGKNRR